jgi:hypothetical protein
MRDSGNVEGKENGGMAGRVWLGEVCLSRVLSRFLRDVLDSKDIKR